MSFLEHRCHHLARGLIAVAILALVASPLHAQRRSSRSSGFPLQLNLTGMYLGAFGGQGAGFQFSAALPIPIDVLGASYHVGANVWYSQPSLSEISLTQQRQLLGVGADVTATWSVSDRFFPYLRVPVQVLHSEVPPLGINTAGLPVQNQPGGATSFAVGIGGGASVALGRGISIFAGATTLSHRLYSTNNTPIWSVELGLRLAPDEFGGRR